MNGADALIETLIDNDVVACFANPGTSEMQFVAALDRQPKMRPVLCLFEGVATGAADGYGRIAGKPACTLLHLGPGYGNGLANLHNARRAFTPIVNVIGDHATYHRQYDAPLTSDIAAIAGANSVWVKSAETADEVGALAAEAIGASYGPPGGSASLILPADCAWIADQRGRRRRPPRRAKTAVSAGAIDDVARQAEGGRQAGAAAGHDGLRRGGAGGGRAARSGGRAGADRHLRRPPAARRRPLRARPDDVLRRDGAERPGRRRPDGAGRDHGRRSPSSPTRTSPACWSRKAARRCRSPSAARTAPRR